MTTDNRQMWADLGIYLESHDNLLNALGPIYQEIYLSQQKRPQGMGLWKGSFLPAVPLKTGVSVSCSAINWVLPLPSPMSRRRLAPWGRRYWRKGKAMTLAKDNPYRSAVLDVGRRREIDEQGC